MLYASYNIKIRKYKVQNVFERALDILKYIICVLICVYILKYIIVIVIAMHRAGFQLTCSAI